MDVHEVLAVVVSGRQDSGKLHDQESAMAASNNSSPFAMSAASPVCIPHGEADAQQGHQHGPASYGLSRMWSGGSVGGSLFGSSSLSRASTYGRSVTINDAQALPVYEGFVAPIREVPCVPRNRVSVSNGGLSRGLADYEIIFDRNSN